MQQIMPLVEQHKLIGKQITVTTIDGRKYEGKLASASIDALCLESGENVHRISASSVIRIDFTTL